MGLESRGDVRNLAIIAHVDHGKTTLVDALIWQSRQLGGTGRSAQDLLASLDPEREKAIPLMPKHVSFEFRGTRVNVLDTPGQADPGGDVDRVLRIVEGFLLVVDAVEGPDPRTRFALGKALEAGLAPLVVLNKIDLPTARPHETLAEVRDTFRDLDAAASQLEFPVMFCNARAGLCRRRIDDADEPMIPLFEAVLESVPPPRHDPEAPLQLLVTRLVYDDFLGRLAMGRVVHGALARGQRIGHCRLDGRVAEAEVGGLYGWQGLRRVELERAAAGDIVEVAGVESVRIGETLADAQRPQPLPALEVEEPAICVVLGVNDSPMAGLDGSHVGADKLRERLWSELLTNTSLRVEETDSPDAFRLCCRSELQLAMLLEMMRREGFEMSIGKPEVVARETADGREEPMERVVIDCPEVFRGVVTQKLEARRGRLVRMVNHGGGRVRLMFHAPARGLLGFRAELLADTKGTGILNHQFDGWAPWQGDIPQRSTGSLVADRSGRCTAHAIGHLQHRGAIFVAPGDEVYEGMIVGENSRSNDLDVNITKPRPAQAGGASPPLPLIPPRSMSLEQALDFLRPDERLEATPRALRLRKRTLSRQGGQPSA